MTEAEMAAHKHVVFRSGTGIGQRKRVIMHPTSSNQYTDYRGGEILSSPIRAIEPIYE